MRFRGTSFALVFARASNVFANSSPIKIMVSVWWLLWAFVVGGYAGMLLIALMLVARKTGVRDSVFE